MCSSDAYGSRWLDDSNTPWAYHERKRIQQDNGSFGHVLAPMVSRVHWLYQIGFEWNCDPNLPKPSESNVQPYQAAWYCDPRTKLLKWRMMSHPMQAGMRHLQRERGRRLAEALSALSVPVPEVPADPEDANIGL